TAMRRVPAQLRLTGEFCADAASLRWRFCVPAPVTGERDAQTGKSTGSGSGRTPVDSERGGNRALPLQSARSAVMLRIAGTR
ncbi:MAG TPA: hypothetical protein VN153_02570, partial [Tahibacter sp.]|nr:hypothetical protein [Tahibacter sp.]